MILNFEKLFDHLGTFVTPEAKRNIGPPAFLQREHWEFKTRLNNLNNWYGSYYPPLKNVLSLK